MKAVGRVRTSPFLLLAVVMVREMNQAISRSAAEVRWYIGYRHGTPTFGSEASGQLYWTSGVPPTGKANVVFSDAHVETLSGAQIAAIDSDQSTSTGFKERTFFKRGIKGIPWQ